MKAISLAFLAFGLSAGISSCATTDHTVSSMSPEQRAEHYRLQEMRHMQDAGLQSLRTARQTSWNNAAQAQAMQQIRLGTSSQSPTNPD